MRKGNKQNSFLNGDGRKKLLPKNFFIMMTKKTNL